ncbi:MAG: 3-deoxy-manno-octulosonate cytidylyltransferase [Pseudomonadota bacterium]|nr:3-deoxy-manno-octulosonate cytidylyltransferase [Pseudomonadota bacterium]
MTFKVVIPARHGATRLPGKPLRQIAGKPMIWHVWRRAVESGAAAVVIATDHASIVAAAREFGADVCLTAAHHASGTDRLAEVCASRGWADGQIVVNLQGDEPAMPAENVRRVAENLAAEPLADLATLCVPVGRVEELLDHNVVKVVRDARDFALYFSRSPIPWHRDGGFSRDAGMPPGKWYRHVGLYAYRVGALRRFAALPVADLEQVERLEQLRALTAGMHIHVGQALALPGIGVDTEADLARVEQLLAS